MHGSQVQALGAQQKMVVTMVAQSADVCFFKASGQTRLIQQQQQGQDRALEHYSPMPRPSAIALPARMPNTCPMFTEAVNGNGNIVVRSYC